MFPILRRKTPPKLLTFNGREESPWRWFASGGRRFYDVIEDEKYSSLADTDKMSAKMDVLSPRFAWVFGTGTGKKVIRSHSQARASYTGFCWHCIGFHLRLFSHELGVHFSLHEPILRRS
jgi:hypothetical protein